jgi:hypothetical protein
VWYNVITVNEVALPKYKGDIKMSYREFTERLSKTCSCYELAENITGHIMDDEDCYDWDATIPENYVKIHLPFLVK